MASNLCVRLVADEQDFRALEPTWNALVDGLSQQSVFYRHEWFDAAWQWCRTDSELRILCVYRAKQLVGILPLILERKRRLGFGIRSLRFLSVPDSQVCDMLVGAENARHVANTLAFWLSDSAAGWDYLLCEKLADSSTVRHFLLPALSERAIHGIENPDSLNPGIPMAGDWKTYYSSRTRRLKTGNNNIANKMERAVDSIEVVWTKDQEIFEDLALQHTLDISAKSWKSDTGLTLDNPGPRDFLIRLTEHARRNSWLSIWVLLLDGAAVASEYQLIYQGTVHALRADYDSNHKSISPGSYLNWKLLERLFPSKATYYSMGPGANPYKDRWAINYEQQFRVEFYGPSFRGKVLRVVDESLKPRLKMLSGLVPWKKS